MDKDDLCGPIGCLVNMYCEFENEMVKIISEKSNESMKALETSVQHYNIAIKILTETNEKK